MVHKNERHHGLGNRRSPDADAGIVAAGGFYRHGIAALIDGSARDADARRRLNPDRHNDILPRGNTTQNAAGVIRDKAIGSEFIAVL